MKFVELLDRTDKDTPKGCTTCVHCATHEKCDGCLAFKDDDEDYKHWEPGNWLRRQDEHEKAGKLNIVIGGQGEAEVNVKWGSERTSKHLHHIAEECGYHVGSRKTKDGTTELAISTQDGDFVLVWEGEKFVKIYRCKYSYEGELIKRVKIWPQF